MPPLSRFSQKASSHFAAKPEQLLCGVVLLANIGAWVWAACLLGTSPLLLGTAGLAWVFGLRHGLDADHIVAIDTVTRKLMLSGRPASRVGLFFSLGHSSVVIAATLLLALLPVRGVLEQWHLIGGVLGTVVSGAFMGLTVIANIGMAAQQWRALKQHQKSPALGTVGTVCSPVGWVVRPFFSLIGRAWHMYPLGFVFGLGFDTASEISLLGMTTLQAAQGVGVLGVLSLPLLFTSAMALVDTLDTVVMCRVYAWRGQAEGRRAIYNLGITLISLMAAAAVAVVELGPLIWGDGSLGAVSKSIDFISEHFSAVGGFILAVFLTLWAMARFLQTKVPS
ncbi:high-affinity nickel permease [Acetobacter cibinongensis NRIC 0482]|nr:high-affinity nickel permease [Acetobacter cibinongensis NRIC 0482]